MRYVSQDVVCALIRLARVFDAKVDVTEPDPGSNPSDDQARSVLEDRADDPTAGELARLIDELDVDQAAELVALFWIGRGDFARDEQAAAIAEARRSDFRTTARYLIGKPLLAEHLEAGLAAFGLACDEEIGPT